MISLCVQISCRNYAGKQLFINMTLSGEGQHRGTVSSAVPEPLQLAGIE